MTEISRPWAGQSPAYAGDAGAYTAENWWDREVSRRASNKLALTELNDVGVVAAADAGGPDLDVYDDWVTATGYNIGDVIRPTADNYHIYVCTVAGNSGASEPTWPTYYGEIIVDNAATWECVGPSSLIPYESAVNMLSVSPGCAIVDGTHYQNDEVVDITIPSTSGGGIVRIDKIVLRKTYALGTQTVRLFRIAGGEETATCSTAVGDPAITQDRNRLTYWDISICSVCVNNTGDLEIIDLREWVDLELKTEFVPALEAYNITDSTAIDPTFTMGGTYGVCWGWNFNSAKLCRASSICRVHNMVSLGLLTTIWLPDNTGDLYLLHVCNYGACDESYTVHEDEDGYSVITMANVQYNNCVGDLKLVDLMDDDILRLQVRRDSTNPLDTINTTVYFSGFLVSYLAWRK